jgi:hypothetical protein
MTDSLSLLLFDISGTRDFAPLPGIDWYLLVAIVLVGNVALAIVAWFIVEMIMRLV